MNTHKSKKTIFFYRGDFHLFKLLVKQEREKIREETILQGDALQSITAYEDRLSMIIQKLEEVEAGAGVHLDKKI